MEKRPFNLNLHVRSLTSYNICNAEFETCPGRRVSERPAPIINQQLTGTNGQLAIITAFAAAYSLECVKLTITCDTFFSLAFIAAAPLN